MNRHSRAGACIARVAFRLVVALPITAYGFSPVVAFAQAPDVKAPELSPEATFERRLADAGVRSQIVLMIGGKISALAILNLSSSGPQVDVIDTDGGCSALADQSPFSTATLLISYGPKGEPPYSKDGARLLILNQPIQVCRILNIQEIRKEPPKPISSR